MKKLFIILILSFTAVSAMWGQQDFVVSGTVSDAKNETLTGVSVYIKNRAGIGTSTDVNGGFSIKVTRGDVIVFNYLGFKEQEYLVDKAITNLKIKMVEAATEIQEVVIQGALGTTQRKISTLAAQSTIDTKELQVPATSIANIIGGRMPGVITVQSSGEPGKDIAEFWVRGMSTFGANSSALVLIDGLEGDLNSIDPADVESFSILKDASATAVYGIRGANGVVLVTTKRGVEGKLKLDARVNYTISKLQRMPKYLHAYDYALLANEARSVRGDTPLYSDADMEVIRYGLDPDLFPDVDWQKVLVNPQSFQRTYYVSASGGGSIARYFLSLDATNQSAAYNVDPKSPYNASTGYNTYSYRTNLDINLTKTTRIYFGVNAFLTRKSQPGNVDTNDLWQSQVASTPLLVPLRYSTGQLPSFGSALASVSPYVRLNYTGRAQYNTNTINSTLSINQDLDFITKGLKFRVQGAYNVKSYLDEMRYVTPDLYYASSRGVDGQLQISRSVNQSTVSYSNYMRQYRKFFMESALNWDKIIAKDHRTSALLYYYMSDEQDTYDFEAGRVTAGTRSMAAIPKRYQGISSRVTYGYQDTYLVDFNFGFTGSENFQKGRRYGFFPSIALGWIPSQYGFVKENLKWIDLIKFRASYGSVGNDKISNTRFPYLTIINSNAASGWGSQDPGITESNIGADNLMWEKALKSNFGFDSRFFKDKLELTLDWFRDQRDGIFQPRANIPSFVGLMNMPYGNIGKMKSWGSEGNIAFSHNIGKDQSFTLRANYTYSTNLVQNWEQAAPLYNYQQLSGYPYQSMRGYISLGLFRDEQDIASSPKQSFSSKVLPGDIKYKDVNGDGVIDDNDRVVLSYPSYPRLMYGFGGEYRYRNLTFGVMFKGTGNTDFYYVGQGVSLYNYTSRQNVNYTNGMGYVPFHAQQLGNVLALVADQKNRWTPASYSGDPATENPDARFPRLTYDYNANNSQLSDFWKGNKRYLRLNEVTLNYNWKSNWFKKVGVGSIDLQLVGDNLYVWDNVKLFDPEQAQLDGAAYPIPLRVTFQVYIHF